MTEHSEFGERVPYSSDTESGPPPTAAETLEVYQRALYEALTRVNDDTPEWAHLIHGLGVAVVMDPDRFGQSGGPNAGHGDPTGDAE